MKGRNVLLLIAISLTISVVLHFQDTLKQRHEIDAVREGLSDINRFITPNSNISFRGEPSKLELYMWARYILAPRFVSYEQEADTMLAIQYLQNSDSALNAMVSERRILYERKDHQYRYLLTARQ